MKTFTIQHSTTYNYDYSPLWVIHKVALTPQNNKRQTVLDWNLIVKGGDYQPKDVVGADIAEVDIFPRINNYSTTKIVEKIND